MKLLLLTSLLHIEKWDRVSNSESQFRESDSTMQLQGSILFNHWAALNNEMDIYRQHQEKPQTPKPGKNLS